MNKPQILLASSSKYRRQLLRKLAINFDWANPNVDESPHPGETAQELVLRLAKAKATKLTETHDHRFIIGSDQAATFGGEILGKPLNHDAAVLQLEKFSGQEIVFLTSLCLLNTQSGKCQLTLEQCKVKFRTLNSSQINTYLLAEQPYDCAGSFKAEGFGITLFKSIHTEDPNILIGLPLIKLTDMLIDEGISPLDNYDSLSQANN